MASNIGVVAAETPQPTASAQTPSPPIPTDDTATHHKRRRESQSPSPRSLAAQQLNSLGSPTKVARLTFETRPSFPVLTGAAALEDERRRRVEEPSSSFDAISDNSSHRALASLMTGGVSVMSPSSDTPQPAPTAAMEPLSKPVNAVAALSLSQGSTGRGEDRMDLSPQSPASIADVPVTESPTAMDVDDKSGSLPPQQHIAVQEDKAHSGSLSYPGSLQAGTNLPEPPTRGISFPIPTQMQNSPTSSSGKKHKCPYCNTEFTRHHNLKSHLLTHSQEKPYVCTECQMRFRRLHDLKRHGKLHTGEKPHVCPKCDRKFARGDALARHNKGAGGCAGRRSSMGSFADGDDMDHSLGDGDESAMSVLPFDNGDDEEFRRQSLPSISSQHVSGVPGDQFATHSRTYPPSGPRTVASGLYPPGVNSGQVVSTAVSSNAPNSMASSHTPNTSVSSVPVGGGNSVMYSQAGMTESPKALSPGIHIHESSSVIRQRSPSLPQHFQQQQMGRRPSELQSPHNGQARPKLPGLSHPGFVAPNSGGFAHGRTSSGAAPAGDSGNMFAQSDPSVWAYIQTLEDKIKALTEKVELLDQEIAGIKKQDEALDGTATA